ncbi:toll/interleukin-1 receptor domain-containing protein [Nitrosovibrio sp. Nv6]|uniref:toll/interleukin-1 receptor domain-containing protein n=1 Tax=Nitrosovibrio sp. Nv6 TaxID=1855340 RepID=UPI0008BD5F63|nr:toll/interleukin-1 receptor domain-containing protein [Nitrosovibrio sp. Nv6]SEP43869.1 TIR domain-containing protein [Nitrosovibrio sp. Nv6]
MPDVFISYSVKDAALADLVHENLRTHDLDVFYAPISLTVGSQWAPQILEALRNSEWFFLLASKNALDSANVQVEVGGAMSQKKKVVPIMWDIQPNELPHWIADYQGLVLTNANMGDISQQVTKLAANIKASKEKAQLIVAAVFFGLLVFSK